MDCRLQHPSKAAEPIIFSPAGSSMRSSPRISANAQYPIDVTEEGITVVRHPHISSFLAVSMIALQSSLES